MKNFDSLLLRRCAAAVPLLAALACLAQSPPEFSWRAPLDVPPGTGWIRVALPADALLRMQSGEARDVRVFNAAGEAVPFAFVAPPAQALPELRTAAAPARPLFAAPAGTRPARGSVQVRMDGAGTASAAGGSVWVQIDPAANAAPAAGSTPLAAALFDLRREKQVLKALVLDATLPANTPIHITASTSTDLAQWTPLPLNGRLFRFEGAADMNNQQLELAQPASLEGRYLRLDWEGAGAVGVASVAGVVAQAAAAPQVLAALPAPTPAGDALEWPLAFGTPIRALALSATRPNSLVTVRVLGRGDSTQPWRLLGSTAVYRLPGSGTGADAANAPMPLNTAGGPALRQLRVESSRGGSLAAAGLQAGVALAPVELVFLPAGNPPYELATGRPATNPADSPLAVVQATTPGGGMDKLRRATPGAAMLTAQAAPAPSQRRLVLWGVLGFGVLVLAGVAWTLLRQLRTPPQTRAA